VREQFPHEGTHNDGSWASQSCVTDGEYLIASFGSFGIYCFDLKGNLIWEKDLGDMNIRASFGEGSSPSLYKDYLIINWDHEKDSYIYVLIKRMARLSGKRRGMKRPHGQHNSCPGKGKASADCKRHQKINRL
jgi:hypothetical protein